MKRTMLLLAVAWFACASATAALADTHAPARASARPGGTHHSVFVFVPTDPFFPDPFWYPDPWWPMYYSPTYGPGYMHIKPAPEGQIPVELHVHPYKAFVSVDGNSMNEGEGLDPRSMVIEAAPEAQRGPGAGR